MSQRVHIEIEGMTRSAFLLRGALAAGTLYGAGTVGPFVGRAFAKTSEGDLGILNFAFALEELESAFYTAAKKSAGLSGELRELATEFGEHEKAHVDVLEQTIQQLGAEPDPTPKAKFGLSDEASFLRTAVELEEIGVAAYLGAAPQLTSADLINAFGAIAQTEARHAAALRIRADEDPAPSAFDEPLPPQQVDAAVNRLVGG